MDPCVSVCLLLKSLTPSLRTFYDIIRLAVPNKYGRTVMVLRRIEVLPLFKRLFIVNRSFGKSWWRNLSTRTAAVQTKCHGIRRLARPGLALWECTMCGNAALRACMDLCRVVVHVMKLPICRLFNRGLSNGDWNRWLCYRDDLTDAIKKSMPYQVDKYILIAKAHVLKGESLKNPIFVNDEEDLFFQVRMFACTLTVFRNCVCEVCGYIG